MEDAFDEMSEYKVWKAARKQDDTETR